MSVKTIELTEQQLNIVVELARTDLAATQDELDANDPQDAETLALCWDVYMTLLKQSDMPGARSDKNPYKE